MRCATCSEPGALVINITPNVHEFACTSCWSAWREKVAKLPLADLARPSFALAEYRRWQAWRRATVRPMPVPREACV